MEERFRNQKMLSEPPTIASARSCDGHSFTGFYCSSVYGEIRIHSFPSSPYYCACVYCVRAVVGLPSSSSPTWGREGLVTFRPLFNFLPRSPSISFGEI